MKPDLLPHESRLIVLWGLDGVMDVSLLLVMTDGEIQDRRGLAGLF
jgi:hypothetical protein